MGAAETCNRLYLASRWSQAASEMKNTDHFLKIPPLCHILLFAHDDYEALMIFGRHDRRYLCPLGWRQRMGLRQALLLNAAWHVAGMTAQPS